MLKPEKFDVKVSEASAVASLGMNDA